MMRRNLALVFGIILVLASASVAQEMKSETSVQGTGFLIKDANGQGVQQEATNTGGVLVGYRHHLTRWIAAEANHGYARKTQKYFTAPAEKPRQ